MQFARRITGSVDGFAQKYDNFWSKYLWDNCKKSTCKPIDFFAGFRKSILFCSIKC